MTLWTYTTLTDVARGSVFPLFPCFLGVAAQVLVRQQPMALQADSTAVSQ